MWRIGNTPEKYSASSLLTAQSLLSMGLFGAEFTGDHVASLGPQEREQAANADRAETDGVSDVRKPARSVIVRLFEMIQGKG